MKRTIKALRELGKARRKLAWIAARERLIRELVKRDAEKRAGDP